ncbi:WD repeat-containing 25 [Pelobates cultripes]|uniref:WD repeat-containing 25 n=1 Tax=Pelobates cultripes TaxID=61616 RepID=A0AAD1TKI1_PELCU|nr:WD repeat-containing 25 [Pelobates cultripes]
MSSLVEYDDSDSETEGIPDCGLPSNEQAENPAGLVIPCEVSRPHSWKKDSSSKVSKLSSVGLPGNPVERMEHVVKFTERSLPYRSHFNPMTVAGTSDFKNHGSYVQKRPSLDDSNRETVVKPYIPKRRKQEQMSSVEDGGEASDQTSVSTADISQNIFRVSDYLGPHLPVKYTSTEIPQKMVFMMNEHAAPVNRVQWNPLRQYSHLLLSASMDTTIKIWDAVDSGKCLKTLSHHCQAARDAQWSLCGHKILSGGFDSTLYLTDVETGKQIYKSKTDFKVSVVRFQPQDLNVFLCGGFSPELKAWDIRMEKAIHTYKAAVQQHFEILFLPGGNEFLSTTDSVSRDSADRTIIAWDFGTTAKISNQIFHERYTCPSLASHPKESVFIAQTNGNYIALFSNQRPYKMNKKKRFEGHKVEGFAVQCEFSPDGSLIVTGSSEGKVFFYNYHTSKLLRSIPGDDSACVSVTFHPVLPSLLASSYWDGNIRVWQ